MKTEKVQDQKEKMQAELQALWKEQCDQLRKKKEQFATEVSRIRKKETTVVDECFFSFLYHRLCLQQAQEHFQLFLSRFTNLKPEFAHILKDLQPSERSFFVCMYFPK